MKGVSQIISCSHPVSQSMPHWPRDPLTTFTTAASLEDDGFFLREFSMGEHSGTHINAPRSFLHSSQERSVPDVAAMLSVPQISPLVVLDVSSFAMQNSDYVVLPQDIERYENLYGKIPEGALVLLFSGWSRYWSEPELFLGRKGCAMHFPAFSVDAANMLISRSIAGLATDTHGLDAPASGEFAVNVLLAEHALLAVECVRISAEDNIPACGAYVVVSGVKLEGGSGAPVEFLVLLS